MSHLGAVLAFVGRLEAIRRALDYDLTDLPYYERDKAAGEIARRLWWTNMRAWKLAAGVR